MNRKLPPNLYARQYKTRGGYTRTLYYPRFKCRDGVRRTFPGVEDFIHAKAELARLQRLDRDGRSLKAEKPGSLFAWVDKFLTVKSGKASANRDRLSARWIKAFFGDCPLGEIVHSRMLEYRKSRAVSERTKNLELAFLRSVLSMAFHDGRLKTMPTIPFEDEHNERVRIATEAELKAIVKGVAPEIRDVLVLLRETGFRLNEVLKLETRDINPLLRAVDMNRIRSKGGLKRALPMSQKAWAILRTRMADKGPLFPGLTRYMVYWHFERVAAASGITGLWVHDLRATFATEKEREGWPRKIICDFTGHRTEHAFKRYSRATFEDLERFIRPNREKWQRIGNEKKREKPDNRASA